MFLLDVIEHLDRNRGVKLLQQCKKIGKRVVLLTPLNWDSNKHLYNDPESFYYRNEFNFHRSLWQVRDFKDFQRYKLPCFGNKYFLGIWEKYTRD